MKLTCLGTGSADWSRKLKETRPDFRYFTSSMVGDSLLIDPGPHIFDFAADHGKTDMFDKVTDVIITHSHPDHINPANVEKLVKKNPEIRFWGSAQSKSKLKNLECFEAINYNEISLWSNYQIAGYKVTPIRGNHLADWGETVFNYIISDDEKTMLYGLDSGWWPCDSWQLIKRHKYDLLVFECTMGNYNGDERIFSHNSVPMIAMMLETIKNLNLIAENGKLYITHISSNLNMPHDELAECVAPLGLQVARDGLEIEF